MRSTDGGGSWQRPTAAAPGTAFSHADTGAPPLNQDAEEWSDEEMRAQLKDGVESRLPGGAKCGDAAWTARVSEDGVAFLRAMLTTLLTRAHTIARALSCKVVKLLKECQH